MLKLDLSTLVTSPGKTAAPLAQIAGAKKKVSVGKARTTIPAGTTKKITIKLNAKGKKLLRKAKKIKTTLTVSQKTGSAYKKVLTKTVTFKAKKKKK